MEFGGPGRRRAARRRSAVGIASAAIALGVVSLVVAPAATADPLPIPSQAEAPGTDRFIVRVHDDAALQDVLATLDGVQVDPVQVWEEAVVGFTASLTASEVQLVASRPGVIGIERDSVVRLDVVPATGSPTDRPAAVLRSPGPPASWGLDRIDQRRLPLDSRFAPAGNRGAGVSVYVVDSGVRLDHTEFAGRIGTGASFVGGTVADCNGHGTHVAGTIGGTTYGVANQVTIVPVRAFGCGGSTTDSILIGALDWILGQHQPGARSVVNMSLSGSSDALDAAVRTVVNRGIPVVVAAGNDSTPSLKVQSCAVSPGRVAEAITVAAIDIDDDVASYSNVGSCNDLFAPGTLIPSAGISSPTAQSTRSGTSMAAPHVTGAVARLLGAHPTATPAQIWQMLDAMATRGAVDELGDNPDKLLFVSPPGLFGTSRAYAVAERLRP